MANVENPILSIEFSDTDYRDPGTGGGGAKIFQSVTPQLRATLRESLGTARLEIESAFQEYPEIPAVMVMQMREDAIAKSHRPLALIQESEVELIGNAALGQLLLATTPPTLDALDHIIASRQTKNIKANISAVSGFFGWGPNYSLSEELQREDLRDRLSAWINAGKPLIVELFRQPTETLNERAETSFTRYLTAHNLRFKQRYPGLIGKSYCVWVCYPEVARMIAAHPAVRYVLPVPEVIPINIVSMAEVIGTLPDNAIPKLSDDEILPVVGVFDTGVDPQSVVLAPWVVDRHTHVLAPETDYLHGTMVASVVAAARSLNENDPRMPERGARIVDVAGMEISNANAEDIIDRLRQSLTRYPDVKVWNLSLGTVLPAPENEFGWFAHQVDRLADDFNVLFVVSAGNTTLLHPWPCTIPDANHRISSPADGVRVLSVGSLAHRHNSQTMVSSEEPSPFTRRGPGPVKTPKPDVVHYGGNCDNFGKTHGTGIRAVLPGDRLGITLGTSFSAPQVAAQAATIWQALETRGVRSSPNLVKALIIHAAAIDSPERSPNERLYFGSGVPGGVLDMLFCDSDAFTLLFEVEVADRRKWTKTPYPIPACLRTPEGKFKGEVILTLVYDPPLDASMGAEYVRANVDVSFGKITYENGSPNVKGVVPLEKGGDTSTLYEAAQIEHGYKWSPVKTYRESFPRGTQIDQWALQASITRRAGEQPPTAKQRAVILVTLRGMEDGIPVYADGVRALTLTNWVSTPIAQYLHVTT